MMSAATRSATSIDIDSCAAFETIFAKTGSNVYELIVLREPGKVLVHGGEHFTTFRSAVLVGSMREGGAIERHTIEIGLRMMFRFENMAIVTSAVQSLSSQSANETVCDREEATS